MKIGVAADHGGFELKEWIRQQLSAQGHEVTDFGARQLNPGDDFPVYVIPLSRAVAHGEVERGIAICGSGVGAAVVANKVPGVRASLITDAFSAHQGVEDDNMNLICLGGRVVAFALAWDLIQSFLKANFLHEARFLRRLEEIADLEKGVYRG